MTRQAQERIKEMAAQAQLTQELDAMLAATVSRRMEVAYVGKGGAFETGMWIARSIDPTHTQVGIASELDGPRKALDNLLRSMGDSGEADILDPADLRYIVGCGSGLFGLNGWEIKLIHVPTGLEEVRTSEGGWRSQLAAKADAVTELTRRVREFLKGH